MRIRTTLMITTLAISTASKAQDIASIDAIPFDKLADIEVTSVSKQPENSFQSAAAVYVLTADEIKRSGATSIPEALRYVPGLEVARIDSNRWAITSRGFNREFANKLLVLLDGRTIYNPVFAGTYWDAQDLVIEDIDRIEVVRGPGATLWGSNAVNGVINIITKDSKFTQGNYASTAVGNFEKNITELRHGGMLNNSTSYRVSGKYYDQGSTITRLGSDAGDSSERAYANWRVDSMIDAHNNVTMIFNANKGQNQRLYLSPTNSSIFNSTENFTGINSMLRWENSEQSVNSQLQMYIDYSSRDTDLLLDQKNTTFDIDWQSGRDLTNRFNLIWGLGYRYSKETMRSHQYDGVALLDYIPDGSDNSLPSAFIQGKYFLVPDTLSFTAGSKFEHNSYTGFAYEPSVRMSWTPTSKQTVWASASHAVRIPSIGENQISLVVSQVAPATYLRALGNENMDAENLTAYELGYRIEPYNWLMFDLATYYNVYNDLRSLELQGITMIIDNKMGGEIKGFEATTRVQFDPSFMVQASYTFTDLHLKRDLGSTDVLSELDNGTSPRNTFNLLTRYNVTENLYLDGNFSTRAELPTHKIGYQTRLDINLTWKPCENMQLGLMGQNLTDNRHKEFVTGTFSMPSEIPRSVLARASINF
jgi:iron complex outermembrane recepter protein